jgi:hypothetical protein
MDLERMIHVETVAGSSSMQGRFVCQTWMVLPFDRDP